LVFVQFGTNPKIGVRLLIATLRKRLYDVLQNFKCMKSSIQRKLEYFDILESIIKPTDLKKFEDLEIDKMGTIEKFKLFDSQKGEFFELSNQINLAIIDYWETNKKNILNDVGKDPSLKTFILRPVIERTPPIMDYLSKMALYANKIIFVDPITYQEFLGMDNGYARFIRRFFISSLPYLFRLKEWVENGILTIVPQPSMWDDESNRIFIELVEKDTDMIHPMVKLAGVIGGKPEKKEMATQEQRLASLLTAKQISWKINTSLFGGASLDAFPATDWDKDYYHWGEKLKNEGKLINPDTRILNVVNKINVKWLDNVPFEFLLKMRKEGRLDELRVVLRENLGQVSKARDDEFKEVVKHARENIENQVKKHDREWSDIKKTFVETVTSKTLPSAFLGFLSGTAASTLSVPTAIAIMAGSGILSTKYAFEEIAKFREKRRNMKRNEIHLLFELKNKYKGPDVNSKPPTKVEIGYIESFKIEDFDM